MSERNLVICDKEFQYAKMLGENVVARSEFALKVYTCTDYEYLLQLRERKAIHILIIDERFTYDKRKEITADKVFVLTKDRCKDISQNEKEIYKFQSVDHILKEVFETYCQETNQDILKHIKKKKQRVIAVYSPVHRIGKTNFALGLGKQLAKEGKTIYINLEEYPDLDGRFERGMSGCCIFRIRGRKPAGRRAPGCVR